MLTRRGLFRKSFAGAALLAVAGAIPVALQRTRLRAPKGPLRFFTEAEYAIWAAVADRILAREAPGDAQPGAAQPGAAQPGAAQPGAAQIEAAGHRPAPPTPDALDVAGRADAFLAPLDPASRRDLKQLLALLENPLFGALLGGRAIPFTQLDPAGQDARLRDWEHSRLALRRTGYQALKRLCCALYFGAPETYASIGYPGPPVELVRAVLQARGSAR